MPATVENKKVEPRSYDVRLPGGGVLRRNRRHLRRIDPSLQREEGMEPLEEPEGNESVSQAHMEADTYTH